MNESSFISTSSFVPTPGDVRYHSGSIVNHDDTDTDIDIASYNLDVISHPVYYIQTIPTDMSRVVMTIYYSSHTVYIGSCRHDSDHYTTFNIDSLSFISLLLL